MRASCQQRTVPSFVPAHPICDSTKEAYQKDMGSKILGHSQMVVLGRVDPLLCDGQFMSTKIDGNFFLPHFNLRRLRHSLLRLGVLQSLVATIIYHIVLAVPAQRFVSTQQRYEMRYHGKCNEIYFIACQR